MWFLQVWTKLEPMEMNQWMKNLLRFDMNITITHLMQTIKQLHHELLGIMLGKPWELVGFHRHHWLELHGCSGGLSAWPQQFHQLGKRPCQLPTHAQGIVLIDFLLVVVVCERQTFQYKTVSTTEFSCTSSLWGLYYNLPKYFDFIFPFGFESL